MLSLAFFTTSCSASAQGRDPRDPTSPLQLVRTIPLPDVNGRLDHLALDTQGEHLFIAENGNGSVDDVDLTAGKVVRRIIGLKEPQGVAWLPAQREIAVTSADGLVTFYRASDLQRVAVIDLGADADNVRLDTRNGHLVVGYGSGGLAVIDPATHHVIGRVLMRAHPEAFEIIGSRAFVNIPDVREIAVAEIDQRRIDSVKGTGLYFGNFPMAYDPAHSWIALAYRAPGTVSVLDAHSGAPIFSAPTCADADDLYFRAAQIVVVCGSGSVDVINDGTPHARVRITTVRGARTGLLDSTRDHLFLAAPARDGPARIWELSFR